MNTFTPEQFFATNKSNVQTMAAFGTKAFASYEKLVELNLAASKAMMTESFDNLQTVMGAKDPSELLSLQTGSLQSMAEKSTAYANHVAAILAESGADITKKFEDGFAESQKGLSALVENISKNAPAGSEAAMALLKSTVSASQNAIESAQNSAKSAMATVESNYAAMTEQAVKATKVATKKA